MGILEDIYDGLVETGAGIGDYFQDWQYSGINGHGLYQGLKDTAGGLGSALDRFGSYAGLTADDKKELEWMVSNSGIPIIGDAVHGANSYNSLTDYMRNYGLKWSDAVYPGLLPGAGSVGSAMMSPLFVSKNLLNLYH